MRTQDVDVLIVPGIGGAGPDHWQMRWLKGIRNAWLVQQQNWDEPDRADWTQGVVGAAQKARLPVFLVGHSLGVLAIVHAARHLAGGKVIGAFLVAPPDPERPTVPDAVRSFAPVPTDPLPFPSLLITSRTDTYCAFAQAEDFALAWGSRLVDAGDAGHINLESGHGPWPEGLLTFGQFLARL